MKPPPPQHSQRGITLLESLVAIVVAALGVLGILGSQMRTLTDTHTSVRRAQAIRLIDDLGERLRANPYAREWVGRQTDGGQKTVVLDWIGGTASPAPEKNCATVGCNPLELAQYDLYWWQRLVKEQLPMGNARIFLAHDGVAGAPADKAQLGVVISWRENEQDGSAEFKDPLNVAAVDVGDKDALNCRAHSTCHLQYIAVPTRCYPQASAAHNVQVTGNQTRRLLCF